MKIEIFEPELIARRGFNGFYRYFLNALIEYAGAHPIQEPRPIPRMTKPREHESAWIRCDDALVFFDMSDHVQLVDVDALRVCAVYFKANFHRGIAERILRERGELGLLTKFAPFLFFSEGLDDFIRDARRRAFWRIDRPRYDVCFVMGVYENPIRSGDGSPFEDPNVPMSPAACHFWIRRHVADALQASGLTGYFRLTSRANPKIEDGTNVRSNISRRAFSSAISRGRITTVCTLPHAVFPWKVSESFVLGRPILLDCEPITEVPERFRPRADVHYLTLLGTLPGPDLHVPWEDPRSYRVLPQLRAGEIYAAVEALRSKLQNRELLREMGEACRAFAAEAYHPQTVSNYICETVQVRLKLGNML